MREPAGAADTIAAASSAGRAGIRSSAPFHRNEGALARAEVHLPRPRDLLLGILEELLPLREPARRSRNCEEHGERVAGDSDRLVDQARVEVDVRIELAFDEV